MKDSKTDRLFLKGPIKFGWLSKAYLAAPNGAALAVANLLMIKLGIQLGEQPVSIASRMYKEFGMERGAYQRGLKALKAAGLVSYESIKGRAHQITIATGFQHKDVRGRK